MVNISFRDMAGNYVSNYFQWDVNQYMVVSGVPTNPAPVFHFSNKNMQESITVTPTVSERGELIAKVPNELLKQCDDIHVYVYRRSSSGKARTFGEIRVKVVRREKPETYNDENEVSL